ncbi:hypothetical protein RTBOTA2_003183 [Rhodotorula toruloides]|uniref:Uncharacterized protein n=1 Tax=Rhodotorula toruloides TaxID=5286 RepID=A0A2T0AB72_RHOTO|nr:hypothetical protein RTBOTA2_003183 [Rhodotorula toruloides]PRQ75216.1 hypothetical protein AAT19DRAFT_14238 [Rhodotorula toruloides]
MHSEHRIQPYVIRRNRTARKASSHRANERGLGRETPLTAVGWPAELRRSLDLQKKPSRPQRRKEARDPAQLPAYCLLEVEITRTTRASCPSRRSSPSLASSVKRVRVVESSSYSPSWAKHCWRTAFATDYPAMGASLLREPSLWAAGQS